ncbi:uncharacterized protein LOC107647536 [Arachis ipaensis]|uniref:uncharacterized protein LOC107647536 n=1 Tax=Arachis ipaensis TaxID=130454 RepID=UPI0007AF5820|nr:uncharacterized protein LOC107647536 [Arachis ipaensis]XP_025627947.1 uncharacterized protein LOC112721088 [Arachis hypogaea]
MTNRSETPQAHRTNADLLAANAALLAENQQKTELLATMQNNGEEKNDNKKANAEQHEEHQSESNAKTGETPPKTGRQRTNPFSEEIMNFKRPKNFTLPITLTPYKGIRNLKVHVTKFESMMFLNSSISNFDEFAKLFINHFAAFKIYVQDSDYLRTIKQGQHESLKDYMTRFKTAVMEIPDLNPEVKLHAIKSGLRPRKFQEAIAVVKPKTLEEFRDKATGQIEIEELRETRRNERPPFRKEEDKPYRSQNKDPKKPFKLAPKFDSYTKFNTKREDILKEILHNKLIKLPSRAGSYQDQRYIDKSKHCAFHQKFGHTTNECVIAKDLLKRLARQGHLDKYINSRVRQTKQNTTDLQPEQNPSTTENTRFQPPPTRGVINCISGGFAGGRHTNSTRKRSYRAMLMV